MTAERALVDAACVYLADMPEAAPWRSLLLEVAGTGAGGPCQTPPAQVTGPDWLPLASRKSRPLVELMRARAAELDWWQPYQGDPRAGPGFAEGARANAIAGPWARLPTEGAGCGFFVVDRGVSYADHAHGPDEIYVPLAGRATFRCESYGEITCGPDRVIVQPSMAWHSMETPESAVLIFWAWKGTGLMDEPFFPDDAGNPVAVDL